MLAPTRETPPRPEPPLAVRRGPIDPPRRPIRRFRRLALFAAILCLIPALFSYVKTMLSPSDSSLGIRTVEWIKDNGARGLVNKVESIYYSLNAPSTGGPALRALPEQPGVSTSPAGGKHHKLRGYRPPRIRPVIHPALAGEGVWRAPLAGSRTDPPVLITSYRPNPNYPQLVAGVAWINRSNTHVQLYPGRQEPGVSLPSRGPMQVPTERRGKPCPT